MPSQFLSLANAVTAALLASPALAGGNVLQGRALPVEIAHAAEVHVAVARSQAEDLVLRGPERLWVTTLTVTCYARATAGQSGDAAVDPLLQAVYARLQGLESSPPPGAQSVTLDPVVAWDVDEGGKTVGVARLTLIVRHITTTATLE